MSKEMNVIHVRHFSPKGMRYNSSSVRIGNKRVPIYMALTVHHSKEGVCWWSPEERRWMSNETAECLAGAYSTHCFEIHSLRAAIHHTKKHTELPIGTVLAVCSPVEEITAYITIKGRRGKRK